MKKRGIWALVLLLGGCAPDLPVTASGDGFTVQMPKGAALKTRPTEMDFQVYSVISNDKELVGIYAGNFPSVDAWGQGENGPNPASHSRPDGTIEYVWRTTCAWPSRLHVWTNGSGASLKVAQRVAASVRPKPCAK